MGWDGMGKREAGHSSSSAERSGGCEELLFVFVCLLDVLLQRAGHEVRARGAPIIALTVLTEANENGVNGHLIQIKEGKCNRKAYDASQSDGHDWGSDGVGLVHNDGGDGHSAGGHKQLAQEHEHVAHNGNGRHAEDVAQHQFKPLFGRLAEPIAVDGDLDVGVAIEELNELVEAPHTALAAAQHELEHAVGGVLGAALDVGQDGAEELDEGDDEGAEGHGAEAVGHGAAEGAQHGERGHPILVACEVPDGNGTSDCGVFDGLDEGQVPEEAKELVGQHPFDLV
eukprot:CAMPEP_0184674480 /NCGR_PEP_ID=MMETSP0308-20130426/87177_1 /TAXON_ID=38269 /ORGANISM="Gloeochaete witrockiana, Strain SAG 46.84" /LENGTH=283 /DNA_ID=CAMNT_0027122085 /DNA_START=912 /DNA_END=1763 /DNA_ORIENTATION=+